MRGLMRRGYGNVASLPTRASGTPPAAVTSRSLSPASVSIEDRNDPAAALPARSIARTTAAPTPTAAITSSDRAGSRKAGRMIRRQKSAREVMSGRHNAAIAHLNHGIDHGGCLEAVRSHQDRGLPLVAYVSQQLQNRDAGGRVE